MKEIVKFKKSLKSHIHDENIVQTTIKNVKEQLIDEKTLNTHKYDTQLLIDICNHVEKNSIKLKNKKHEKFKTQKKDIVLKIFDELFAEIDLDLIDASIETILNNNLVKKYTLFRRVIRKISSFFFKN